MDRVMEIARLKARVKFTDSDLKRAVRLLIAEYHKRYPNESKIKSLESEVKKQKTRLGEFKAELQRKEETESA